MCENNREEFDNLQGCSSATFEMLLPHELYRDREGMDEYYEHTVRKIADNLTLQEVECTVTTIVQQLRVRYPACELQARARAFASRSGRRPPMG